MINITGRLEPALQRTKNHERRTTNDNDYPLRQLLSLTSTRRIEDPERELHRPLSSLPEHASGKQGLKGHGLIAG